MLIAWETAEQVYFAPLDPKTLKVGAPIAAPGQGNNRKHPSVTANAKGETLLVWTEGTGWKRGGSLAWQRFDATGRPLGNPGASPGLPAWDFAAAIASQRRFLIIS